MKPEARFEKGQSMLEYGWIMLLIALALVILLTVLGNSIADLYRYAVPKLIAAFGG